MADYAFGSNPPGLYFQFSDYISTIAPVRFAGHCEQQNSHSGFCDVGGFLMRVFAFFMFFVGVAFAESALGPPQGSPASTNWWRAEPSCHPGHIDKPNINAFVLGAHCDIALIQKDVSGTGVNFADWINDGLVGIPVAADNVLVAIAGTNGPDVVYLYGIKSDGTVVIAFPGREYADGSRTARYGENNSVIISSTETGGRRYCWTGLDWFEGLDSTSCDMTHHARLVALRAQGQGLQVVRQDYFGP